MTGLHGFLWICIYHFVVFPLPVKQQSSRLSRDSCIRIIFTVLTSTRAMILSGLKPVSLLFQHHINFSKCTVNLVFTAIYS